MAKKKNFKEYRDEWEPKEDRKRYDRKKQKIRNARKNKRKQKHAFFDSE